MLATGAALAHAATLNFPFPLERQVFQRNAEEWAEIKLAGAVPDGTALVEAKGIARRGPDTNDLVGSSAYRHDGIHFGPRGLLVHAERWYTILNAHYGWANPVTQTLTPGQPP